jgi:hypothetical protein
LKDFTIAVPVILNSFNLRRWFVPLRQGLVDAEMSDWMNALTELA